ncbi:copper resistance protein CopC [Micromonospora sp. RTGN7]|uniref:copper resistance CopC family protein n=1 Tax=Micromonospora sp. RTGN7 TaxID=3016526 RepID=UPI0029FF2898|nr:copper resistance protein CopC [Micromonospora sp. RTGN7]
MSLEPPDPAESRAGNRAVIRRRVAAVAVALLALSVVGLGLAVSRSPARLESVAPADEARPATAAGALSLTFSGRVDPREAHVTVVDDTGRSSTGPVRVHGRTVTVSLPTSGPGDYLLGYHVLLGDGSAVSGQTTYRVGPDPVASRRSGAPRAVGAPGAAGHDHVGSGPLTVAVLIVATVLTGLTPAILFRRPRRPRRDG